MEVLTVPQDPIRRYPPDVPLGGSVPGARFRLTSKHDEINRRMQWLRRVLFFEIRCGLREPRNLKPARLALRDQVQSLYGEI